MIECLKNEVNVVYINLDASPEDIRNRVLKQDLKMSKNLKKLTFIDGYSWLLNEVNENYHISHISNLNDLSVKIFNSVNKNIENRLILIFDSISSKSPNYS